MRITAEEKISSMEDFQVNDKVNFSSGENSYTAIILKDRGDRMLVKLVTKNKKNHSGISEIEKSRLSK